jgi:hypothetical protein
MNNIINSSGEYDINSYNSISNNTTVLSTFNVSGITQLNTTAINSSWIGSGITMLDNDTTINRSLIVCGNVFRIRTTLCLGILKMFWTASWTKSGTYHGKFWCHHYFD